MQSPCIREASKACFNGCCPIPFVGLPEPQESTPKSPRTTVIGHRLDFNAATISSLQPNTKFTNHESLPCYEESFSYFNKAYPQYSHTDQTDQIRAHEYHHLSISKHVCLDYIGHGLFSYSQEQSYKNIPISSIASTSSSSSPPPPTLNYNNSASNVNSFDILYKSVNLKTQLQYGGGGQEPEFESKIRKRIMSFMNVSEDDYSLVFTANKLSAFKLVADSYPFQTNKNLLTVYDHENEAVEAMTESSKKRGARVRSAEFSWPRLRVQSRNLKKIIVVNRKKRKGGGLFVFPLQSRMTGARYSYLWMSLAQENGWHVLLDASALGAKDMETLGLSLFQPDFLVCSFFKVFGDNPSGFCCLFVKKSSASVLLNNSNTATKIGIVSLVPPSITDQQQQQQQQQQQLGQTSEIQSQSQTDELQVPKQVLVKHNKSLSFSEIVEIEEEESVDTKIEFRGLDHADTLGLIQISSRARYLINWLVNALMSLQHPHSENGIPLITIYGPKIRSDRGPSVAFNVFDWKGEKVDPILVQKLADRNNISLSYGFLRNIWFSENYEEERDSILERRSVEQDGTSGTTGSSKTHNFESGISVVNASLGFLADFEDMYRLWAFVSRFLDADFVEKERWRYKALNQTTIEV